MVWTAQGSRWTAASKAWRRLFPSISTYFSSILIIFPLIFIVFPSFSRRVSWFQGSLGAVYYNFPHAGAVSGFFDGHPCVNWRHENLMRLFFRALRSFMKPGGPCEGGLRGVSSSL